MTLDGYYERWGLPPDYPKQCASVSQRKREIAEKTGLGQVRRKRAGANETRPEPAVPIDQSVTDTHIICLEDGKSTKNLKRYLSTQHNMTIEEYKEKWGLPDDYKMMIVPKDRQRTR
ncbi:MAG: MucR family transcriptional regulator [Rhodospirillales bacterium]|nr:MucR family transcriptional regulator [Rhodospirillales bacterium]